MLTYQEIKEVLDGMTKEQLSQPAQVFMPQDGDEPTIALLPAIAFKTVKELVSDEAGEELQETRSSFDN
jgi:hypothetical protein